MLRLRITPAAQPRLPRSALAAISQDLTGFFICLIAISAASITAVFVSVVEAAKDRGRQAEQKDQYARLEPACAEAMPEYEDFQAAVKLAKGRQNVECGPDGVLIKKQPKKK